MKGALEEYAARLGLYDIDISLDRCALKAAKEKWTYERFLTEVFIHQCEMADKRSSETLLKFAGFPYKRPSQTLISPSKSPSQNAS